MARRNSRQKIRTGEGDVLFCGKREQAQENKDMQNLRKDLHQDISAINSRLGRIEGRLFGAEKLSAG